MSTMPWGTMNGWLQIEAEQRGMWQRVRAQDLRAAQVVRQAESAAERPTRVVADRPEHAVLGCPEAEAA